MNVLVQRHSAPRAPAVHRPRPWLGLSALVALPMLLLADLGLALARGWRLDSEGFFGKLQLAAPAGWLLLAVPLLALPVVRRWSARRWAQLWTANVALVVGWLGSELVLARAGMVAPFHGRPPGVTYHFEPDFASLPGLEGAADSRTNSLGLRGPEWPARTTAYRVLCLGGSTVECCFLDEQEWWPARLEQELRQRGAKPHWTGAAAVSEFSSGHHARWLESSPLVSEVDAVVLLVGGNDFVRLVLGLDAGDAWPPQLLQSGALALVKQIWNVRLGRGLVIDAEGTALFLRRQSHPMPEPAAPIVWDEVLAGYRQRIERSIAAARRRGVRLILVTQPALWDEYLSAEAQRQLWLARTEPEPRDWKLLTAQGCRAALDRYNQVLVETARAHQVELVDAAAVMSGVEPYFYDDYHLSERGCAVLGRLLAEHMTAPSTSHEVPRKTSVNAGEDSADPGRERVSGKVLLLAAAAAFAHEDLGTIGSGITASRGSWTWAIALVGCLLGSFVADWLWYAIGRRGGRWALERAPLKWLVKREHLVASERWFARRGMWIIVLCRFVPGASTPLQFATGALGTPWPTALAYFVLATCIHVPVLFGLAYLAGELALDYLPIYQRWGLPAAAALVGVVWFLLRAVERGLAARELPAIEP
ncbi:MAG: VTT domain-containing protein [Pirellulales bacterium]|nr:VTT domain-containing protein [Pirellulales bacterium]